MRRLAIAKGSKLWGTAPFDSVGALCCIGVLVAVACNSQSQAAATPSPSASPAPLPVISPVASSAIFSLLPTQGDPSYPYPIKDCSDAGGVVGASDPVAFVLPNGKEYALRDYADPDHPRTLCRFSNNQIVQLIDSRHIVVVCCGFRAFAVVDLPEMVHHWFKVPVAPPNEAFLLGVSPGLDQVAWLGFDVTAWRLTVHVYTSQGDQVSAPLPAPGSLKQVSEIQPRAAFSPSGRFLYVLDRRSRGQPEDPSLRSLVVVEGSHVRLKLTPPVGGWPAGSEPASPLWSPVTDTLYYSQSGTVWTWTPESGSRPLLRGTSWCLPTISADGRYVAYGAQSAGGALGVYLATLGGSVTPRLIGQGPRNEPAFLGTRLLWYRSWNGSDCMTGGGQSLVYDMTDGAESRSVLNEVDNLWPATSSVFTGVNTFLAFVPGQ